MVLQSRIFFTGITGLLGGYFLKNRDLDYEIIGITKTNLQKNKAFVSLDITNKISLIDFTKEKNPDIIIHAASLGNVDYCETHPDEAYKVNVEGTKNIIEAAKEVNARLIFMSSNAIYDGVGYPFDEKSKPNPIDVYGRTKVEGENIIKKSNLDYAILRLMTMYGWFAPGGRTNPAAWVIDKLRKGEAISVVNDVYNNHLWASQAADVVWKIIKNDTHTNKAYNVAGKDCINRFEFALKVAKVFDLDSSLITPVKSSFFKNIAARPKNTCFNTLKIEKELGIKPLTVNEGLGLMKKEKK